MCFQMGGRRAGRLPSRSVLARPATAPGPRFLPGDNVPWIHDRRPCSARPWLQSRSRPCLATRSSMGVPCPALSSAGLGRPGTCPFPSSVGSTTPAPGLTPSPATSRAWPRLASLRRPAGSRTWPPPQLVGRVPRRARVYASPRCPPSTARRFWLGPLGPRVRPQRSKDPSPAGGRGPVRHAIERRRLGHQVRRRAVPHPRSSTMPLLHRHALTPVLRMRSATTRGVATTCFPLTAVSARLVVRRHQRHAHRPPRACPPWRAHPSGANVALAATPRAVVVPAWPRQRSARLGGGAAEVTSRYYTPCPRAGPSPSTDWSNRRVGPPAAGTRSAPDPAAGRRAPRGRVARRHGRQLFDQHPACAAAAKPSRARRVANASSRPRPAAPPRARSARSLWAPSSNVPRTRRGPTLRAAVPGSLWPSSFPWHARGRAGIGSLHRGRPPRAGRASALSGPPPSSSQLRGAPRHG